MVKLEECVWAADTMPMDDSTVSDEVQPNFMLPEVSPCNLCHRTHEYISFVMQTGRWMPDGVVLAQ